MSLEDRSDYFTWGAEDVILTQCAYCTRLAKGALVCAAFPGSIPAEILENRFDHREPWIDPEAGEPGDTGFADAGSILFEPRPGVPPDELDRLWAEIARARSIDGTG